MESKKKKKTVVIFCFAHVFCTRNMNLNWAAEGLTNVTQCSRLDHELSWFVITEVVFVENTKDGTEADVSCHAKIEKQVNSCLLYKCAS